MSTIQETIDALELEREGYVIFDKTDRVDAVDEQLEYWRGQLEKNGAEPDGEDLGDQAAAIAAKIQAAKDQQQNETEPAAPALNATTDEWRTYAAHPQVALDVPEDAGHDVIVAAYIERFAPANDAALDDWAAYARSHAIEPDGKSIDELRAEVVDAGWAIAPAAPTTPPAGQGKRNTADSKPRTTR